MGSVADWTDLHSRFIVLAETWMHRTPDTCPWVKAVDEFLKQFVAARSGELAEDIVWLKCSGSCSPVVLLIDPFQCLF